MTARTFVDTNVWVYAVDGADPAKQARARAVLAPSSTTLVTSAQVLGEFYVTVTRKLARPVPAADADRLLAELRRLPIVAVDADLVIEATEGSRRWGIAYWDALVIAAARSAGCSRLLSEDLSDGVAYGDVTVENPFRGPPRVSEQAARYGEETGTRRWTDADLLDALGRYEQACVDAGMQRNTVHSYWDYARRFLAWRRGEYVPRGATLDGRPVPTTPATADELAGQARSYARAVELAGRNVQTIDTYHRHAMFFVRWLGGDFEPGRRLRG